MNIVILDGYCLNPGDLSWQGFEELGLCKIYDRTRPEEVLERAKGAEILITNKTVLDADIMGRISRAGIRTDYLQAGWATDFVLRYADGHKGVRELIQRKQLKKKAYVERLELSRRYWTVTDTEWMVVIVNG